MSGRGMPTGVPDPRLAAIDRDLGTPLASARAAEERVWTSLRTEPRRPASAPRALAWGAVGLAAAAAAFVAIGWAQSLRVEVASGGLPTLYRLEAGRAELDAPGARGRLTIGERYLRDPNRLSAVADASIRLQPSALPAEVEIRFLGEGESAHGVLARTFQITDAPPDGAVITHEAPFPPLGRGERRVYRVWLQVTLASGEHASQRLAVEVVGSAEGQRVRHLGTE